LKTTSNRRQPQGDALPCSHNAPPRRKLSAEEVEDFLSHLFENVAYKPSPLKLKDAAVARFLLLLSLHGVPRHPPGEVSKEADEDRKVRLMLDRFAWEIFDRILSCGEFKPSTKEVALCFLEKHRRRYFCPRWRGDTRTEQALKFVKSHELPMDAYNPFKSPVLIGPQLNMQGHRSHRVDNDVSERVFAAYHALAEAGVKSRGKRIADALNKADVPQTRGGKAQWAYADVHDRVKSWEKQELKSRKHVSTEQLRKLSIDRWVSYFHFARQINSNTAETPR
jgi:hypothetical protein